ncbi:MAG: radical SAM protein [Candidatus Woesearchaeota archaeon]|nr:radical SAM protein [Candidatus Woesearchaeota archaeon]
MAELKFQDISFSEGKDSVRANFLRIFCFEIPKEELSGIAPFKIDSHSISFECPEKRASSRFYNLLERGFLKLKNSINGRKAVYIHRNSGIPLIGSNAFGIVDRNTSCVEVKPITGCNIDCGFCSVDEGLTGKKTNDIVVEEEYLISEFRKLAEKKKCGLEAHINANGEPLLYSRIVDLIRDLKAIPNVNTISIDTNATMLTKELAGEMAEAGLTRFNISLSAIDDAESSRINRCRLDTRHVMEIVEYAATIADVIIAPVWIPGLNDSEIPKIIDFSKRIRNKSQKTPFIGIQNFLNYPHGRNPVKGIEMEEFRKRLALIEKKSGEKLILGKEDFGIKETEKLQKPFKKGDIVSAEIKCEGRFPRERIACAKDRNITILSCDKDSGIVKVKILRSKHNIFLAKKI